MKKKLRQQMKEKLDLAAKKEKEENKKAESEAKKQ